MHEKAPKLPYFWRTTTEIKSRHGAEKITSRWKFFFFVERAPFASRCNFFSSVMVFWRHRRKLKIRLRAGRTTGSAGAIKRMADKRKFYCPSFQKALPIVLENIARSFFKRCPWFFKTMPVIFSGHGQRFLGCSFRVSRGCLDRNRGSSPGR